MNKLSLYDNLKHALKHAFDTEGEWLSDIQVRPWQWRSICLLLLLLCIALAFLSGYYHSILRTEGIL